MKILVISIPCLDKEWRSKLEKAGQDKDLEVILLLPWRWVVYGRPVLYEKNAQENIKVLRGKMCFTGHINRNFFCTGLIGAMRLKPDIIHLEVEPSSMAALQVLILKPLFSPRARIIIQSSKGLIVKDNLLSRLIQRYVLKRVDVVFSVSERCAQFIRGKRFKGKIYIHPNGVGKEFRMMEVTPLRRELKLDNTFVIGYVGRLVKEKGLDLLLKACRGLPLDYRLLWVGEGKEETRLKNLAQGLGLRPRLLCLGHRPHAEMPLYLNCMDVAVLPSRTQPWWEEYFGRTLIEAMACGVPVIGSSCGAIPWVIDGAGLIFEEGCERDLAEKIKLLATDINLRARLREEGLKRVRDNYTWAIIAEQTWQVYRKLGHEIIKN